MGHFDKIHPSQVDDLAQKVTEQVSKGQLDNAYTMMKTELHAEFSTMPLEEKRQTWNAISQKLEENGTLPKLAAAWLADLSHEFPKGVDVSFTKSQLDSIAKNALDPFYSGFAAEMSKQFDVASRLGKDDGKIDADEVAAFKDRQLQASPEKFADNVVKNVEKYSATSPTEAYSYLSSVIFDRAKRETPEEEAATWKNIDEKLNANGLIPKLSMGFLDANFHDKPVTLSQMASIEKGSPNQLTKELTGYIVRDFSKIGTVDYHLDEISVAERKLYTQKLSEKK
jgi:hypothetical protein